jgi:hypothetical protein
MADFKSIAQNLAPTSIAVVINDLPFAEEIRRLNKEIIVYDLSVSGNAKPERYIEDVLNKHFGKIVYAQRHFQIDFLYCGEGASSAIIEEFRKFSHTRGWVIYPDKHFERHMPQPAWDVPIARLKLEEKEFLYKGVSQLRPGSVYVEVGTYKGGSAALAAVANPQIKIYAVDIWLGLNPPEAIFKRHTQFFDNIIPIKVDFNRLEEGPLLIAQQEGVPLSELKIDFLFIDGAHDYDSVRADLNIYDRYATFICGHDFMLGNDVHAAVLNHYSQWNGIFSRKTFAVKAQKRLLGASRYCGSRLGIQGGNSSLWFRKALNGDPL